MPVAAAWLSALGTAVAATTGCPTGTCNNGTLVVAPVVTVTNATTGAAICDATVVAMLPADASYSGDARLWPWAPTDGGEAVLADGGSTSCEYGGDVFGSVYDTPITIQVSKPGFRTATATAEVYTSSCADQGTAPTAQQVDVALQPN